VVASREHLNASLKEHVADLEAAEKRLKALGPHRIGGAVAADIAKLKKDRVWDATAGCNEATLAASREFCKRIEELRAELALAAEDNVLTAKIEGLKYRIAQLRERGAGRAADPQLGEIARATGADVLRVRSGMNWLLAIAVEAVSCFGLFAIAWQREGRGRKSAKIEAQDTRPWRVVDGEAAAPGRPLLRLPAPGEGGPPARKTKRGAKASGKTGRKPRAGPNGNAREAETDQPLKQEEGAGDVR
jgi:hypothetical protein